MNMVLPWMSDWPAQRHRAQCQRAFSREATSNDLVGQSEQDKELQKGQHSLYYMDRGHFLNEPSARHTVGKKTVPMFRCFGKIGLSKNE